MKVGGTKVGFRGRWVSNAPTAVLRQKSDWVKKKIKRGIFAKRVNKLGNWSTLTWEDRT